MTICSPFFADKAVLPSISSERSAEDISNLQLKGNSSNPSEQSKSPEAKTDKGQVKTATTGPTKPILKTRRTEGVPYTGTGGLDKGRYGGNYNTQVKMG